MSLVLDLAAWLTPGRIRAQAAVLAVCLWAVHAVDFATPGLFDRAGNIKFQDFLQFPIAARLIAQGRAAELYNDNVLNQEIHAIAGDTRVQLQYFYGPQVALPFVPLLRFSFLTQAVIWAVFSLLIYFGCIYLLSRSCASLKKYRALVLLCAVAYPPAIHFFVRGQLSAVVLLFFTAAYLAFLARRDWLAGLALGCLIFKPQFLVAIPLVLLLGRAWTAFAGLAISAAMQALFTFLYFGSAVTRSYLAMLIHSAAKPNSTQLKFSPIQMHSLHTFWSLLIPWPRAEWVCYLLSCFCVIAIAAAVWRSSSSLPLRFSALLLAAVLVNPHLYIYDLLALAPAFLLLVDWTVSHAHHPFAPALGAFSYLAFVLPLFGPLAYWTHVQLSVAAFVFLLWIIWRCSTVTLATPGHKLALNDSDVV